MLSSEIVRLLIRNDHAEADKELVIVIVFPLDTLHCFQYAPSF